MRHSTLERQEEVLEPLQFYLHQASETPLLNSEEERQLATQMRRGDQARKTLLTMTERLVAGQLRHPRVGRALAQLMPLLSETFMDRAREEVPTLFQEIPASRDLSNRRALGLAIAIAKEKLRIRNRQTNDTEAKENLDTLLHVNRVIEETLVPLAKRLAPRAGGKRTVARFGEEERTTQQGEAAREHLRNANLLLVVSVAARPCYEWGDLSLEDRIQEGNIGLMKAVDSFDPETFGTRFSSYAVPFIEHAIDRALKNQSGNVRRPVHVHDLVGNFRRELQILEQKRGVPIAIEEGMDELGVTGRKRKTLQRAMNYRKEVPLVFSDGEERVGIVEGQVHSDEGADGCDARERVAHFRDRIRGLLPLLTTREGHIISMRLGLDGSDPKMQREIGEHFGVTRAAIQQIEVRAIRKLQAALGNTNGTAHNGDHTRNGQSPGKLTHGSYAALFRQLETLLEHENQPGTRECAVRLS